MAGFEKFFLRVSLTGPLCACREHKSLIDCVCWQRTHALYSVRPLSEGRESSLRRTPVRSIRARDAQVVHDYVRYPHVPPVEALVGPRLYSTGSVDLRARG